MKANKHKMRQANKFKEAHEQIQRDSKGCFIASYCFGKDDYITNELRTVKPLLEKSILGKRLIGIYYRFSQKFIIQSNWPFFRKAFTLAAKFPLYIFAKYLIFKRENTGE
jgi:hypothetical protein